MISTRWGLGCCSVPNVQIVSHDVVLMATLVPVRERQEDAYKKHVKKSFNPNRNAYTEVNLREIPTHLVKNIPPLLRSRLTHRRIEKHVDELALVGL